jgi:hypothetical protein
MSNKVFYRDKFVLDEHNNPFLFVLYTLANETSKSN